MDTTNYYIALYDAETDRVSFPLAFEEGKRKHWEPRQAGDGLTEHVIHSRQPVLIRENVGEHIQELGIEMIGQVALSWLGVPLILADRVLGAMAIQTYATPGLYGEHERDLLIAIASQTAIALQNAQMFEETQRRAREVQLLYDVGLTAAAGADLEETLQAAVEIIAAEFEATLAGIALADLESNTLRAVANVGRPSGISAEARMPLGEGIIGWVAQNSEPLLIPDVQLDPRYKDPVSETRSELCVPLVIGSRVIGILNVESCQVNAFTEDDLLLLTALANNLSVVVELARSFDETQHRAQQMKVINEVGQTIASVLDPDAVLQQIVDTTKARFGHYFVCIVLVEEERQLIPRIGSTIGNSGVRLEFEHIGVDLASSSSLAAEAARTGQPVLVNDALNDPRYLALEGLPDTRSELCLPIKVKGRTIGILDVESDQSFAFDQTDVELHQALANQAGVAIENARLFKETHLRAEELAVLNELGQALTARLSVEEVLNEAYRQASRLVDTSTFRIGLYDAEEHEITSHGFESGQCKPRNRFSADQGISGYIVRNRTSVLLRDNISAWEREHGIERVGEPAVCWLGVPLLVGDRTLGTMYVQDFTTPGLYDEHDRELLAAIANQTAIALQNAQMVENLEQMVEERTTELRESLEERERLQQDIIEAQRQSLQELSTPIIPIMDRIIVMPLIGSIDTMRARDITRALLAGIREHRAQVVILDITGVPIVDSGIASHLTKTIQAARLKGARTIVTGVSDAVAETIVDLGIDWEGIETLADLQTGLIIALKGLGIRFTR
jgi:GAF domain-containing protein